MRTRGKGVKKSENFADVISGSSLRKFSKGRAAQACRWQDRKRGMREAISCGSGTLGTWPGPHRLSIQLQVPFFNFPLPRSKFNLIMKQLFDARSSERALLNSQGSNRATASGDYDDVDTPQDAFLHNDGRK